MNVESKKKLILGSIIALYALIIVVFFLTPQSNAFSTSWRLFALLGMVSMSISAMMTPFAIELYKIFGKSFVKLHHIFAILGVILITLHPVIFAVYVMNPLVFIPVVNDWVAFWELAGRPALILIYIGVVAGILRKTFNNQWKKVHALLYVALFFGIVHGTLIGTSFQNPIILITFYGLFIGVILAFAIKRYKTYQRKQKMKARKAKATN